MKDVRPQGWGLTPPYLDYLESEDKSATSTNGANGDLKKLFPPSYFVRLVGRLTHSLQVHHKFFSRSIYCNLQVYVQGFTKRWTLGCEKFLPGLAWLLLSVTGPPFSPYLCTVSQPPPDKTYYLISGEKKMRLQVALMNVCSQTQFSSKTDEILVIKPRYSASIDSLVALFPMGERERDTRNIQ